VLGDTDMTLMRIHFVKPQAIVSMSFSEDPQMGARLRPVYRIGRLRAGDAAVRDADRIAALKHVVIAGEARGAFSRETGNPFAKRIF